MDVNVDTPDGRRLRVEVAGDGRRVIVVQVGSPNGGTLYDAWVEDAAARELTLITYDRPGYGGSSRQPGRSVADCAADVRAIAQAVGFDRCAVWGLSGGGPHALACGALLDGLVVAVVTIGSLAPFDTPGFDFYAGYPDDEARKDHELFLSDRAEWERESAKQGEELLALRLEEHTEQWSIRASPADRVTLQSGLGAWLHQAVQSGIASSIDGWIDDDIAFHTPWGFDPATISIPTKIYHGDQDHFVPVTHGQWLATHIPTAEPELTEEDGHFTVLAHRIGEVHAWLAHHL